MKLPLIILLAVSATDLQGQDILDVAVRGISDARRDGVQQDRLEAILDAKRQACEMAGLRIESTTTVENFQTVYDFVETQAEAVLLPGFQVIDNGYGEDGAYTVVLVGKIRTVAPALDTQTALFTIIVWFYEWDPPSNQSYQLLDRLYEWLQMAHGVFRLDDVSLETLEDQLVEVARADALAAGQQFYAFTYRLPTGTLQYEQSTRGGDGSISVSKVQKARLRPGLHYVMQVAGWNAVYFENPAQFDGSISNDRLYGTYPGDFAPVYIRP